MTHINLGVALGLGLELRLGGAVHGHATDSRGEEAAGDHGGHFDGTNWRQVWLIGGCFFGVVEKWAKSLLGIVVLKLGSYDDFNPRFRGCHWPMPKVG